MKISGLDFFASLIFLFSIAAFLGGNTDASGTLARFACILYVISMTRRSVGL